MKSNYKSNRKQDVYRRLYGTFHWGIGCRLVYIELLTECIKRLPRLTYFYRICKCQLYWASALNCTVAPRKELACNNKNNCNENHSTLFTDSLSSGSDEEIFGSPSFSCSASYQKRGEQVIILSVHRKCESGKQRRKLSKTSMLMDAQDNKNPSSIITKCVCIHKDASFFSRVDVQTWHLHRNNMQNFLCLFLWGSHTSWKTSCRKLVSWTGKG